MEGGLKNSLGLILVIELLKFPSILGKFEDIINRENWFESFQKYFKIKIQYSIKGFLIV